MQAVLDVGANNGDWGIRNAQANPRVQFFGFEPTPELCEIIRKKVADAGLKNYELIPHAVSDVEGTLKFNVDGQDDWGCSSLLEFSDNLEKHWPGTQRFRVTKVIDVQCIRLDRFVQERGITSIYHLHCDTQGTDLRVLASLGDSIRIVKRGEIETASARAVALYKNQHTIEDVVIFFLQHGLEIEKMWPNDHNCNELNVIFRRRG